jgi:hypothetical protein
VYRLAHISEYSPKAQLGYHRSSSTLFDVFTISLCFGVYGGRYNDPFDTLFYVFADALGHADGDASVLLILCSMDLLSSSAFGQADLWQAFDLLRLWSFPHSARCICSPSTLLDMHAEMPRSLLYSGRRLCSALPFRTTPNHPLVTPRYETGKIDVILLLGETCLQLLDESGNTDLEPRSSSFYSDRWKARSQTKFAYLLGRQGYYVIRAPGEMHPTVITQIWEMC